MARKNDVYPEPELNLDGLATNEAVTTDPVLEASEINEETRIPFGAMGNRLDYESRPGYHRHWFNDSPGRIMRAEKAGYKHVLDADGKVVTRPVGVMQGGGALMGFLMEIPEEWWKKDLDDVQRNVDKVDEDIRLGNIRGKVGQDGRYIPENRPIKMDLGSKAPPVQR